MARFPVLTNRARGLLAVCLAATAVLAWNATTAEAQGGLEPIERHPLPGMVVTTPPTEVRLRFSTPLATPLASYNFVQVYNRYGARVDLGPAPADGMAPAAPDVLQTRLKPLDPGLYTVRWRATAQATGAATDGSYAFGLAPRPGSASWVPMLAAGIAGILIGMAIGAWLVRLRRPGWPQG